MKTKIEEQTTNELALVSFFEVEELEDRLEFRGNWQNDGQWHDDPII